MAVLNLIATYLGGTLLSVPYAVSQCGIITSLVVLSLAAAAAQFSMNVLCSAARKAQRGSYVEVSCSAQMLPYLISAFLGSVLKLLPLLSWKVARVAFGELGAYITTICLLTLTCFLLVGYERLLRDIVRSLVEYVIDDDLSDRAANLVLCLCLLAILPVSFLLKPSSPECVLTRCPRTAVPVQAAQCIGVYKLGRYCSDSGYGSQHRKAKLRFQLTLPLCK